MYIGSDEIEGLYIGSDEVLAAYVGDDPVWESNVSWRVSPAYISVDENGATKTIRITADDDWEINGQSSWVSFSSTAGTSGTSSITVTISSYNSVTNRVAVFTAQTPYSGHETLLVIRQEYQGYMTHYLDVTGSANIVTDWNPAQIYDYTGSCYMSFEIAAVGKNSMGSSNYLFNTPNDGGSKWFSLENIGGPDDQLQGWGNIADTAFAYNTCDSGHSMSFPLKIVVNYSSKECYWGGNMVSTFSFDDSLLPNDVVTFFPNSDSENTDMRFYYCKVYSGDPWNEVLVRHFVPHPSGTLQDLVTGTVYPKSGSGTAVYGNENNVDAAILYRSGSKVTPNSTTGVGYLTPRSVSNDFNQGTAKGIIGFQAGVTSYTTTNEVFGRYFASPADFNFIGCSDVIREAGKNGLFNRSLAKSVDFGNAVNIGSATMPSATSLTDITFGSEVAYIAENQTVNCPNVKFITIKATTPPQINGNPFNGCASDGYLLVPKASLLAYETWASNITSIQNWTVIGI